MKTYQYNPADYARACCGVQINQPHTDECLLEIRQRHPCGWPRQHDEESEPSGPARGGWANGQPTHILRCKRCGETRGPFVDNSGDAGF